MFGLAAADFAEAEGVSAVDLDGDTAGDRLGQSQAHAAAGNVQDFSGDGCGRVGSEELEGGGSGELKTGLAAAFHMGTYRRGKGVF